MKTSLSHIKNWVRQNYNETKKSYVKSHYQVDIPYNQCSHFVNIGGAFEVTYIFQKWLPNPPAKVLVIGAFGGRDYFYLKSKGYSVVALDLVKIQMIDNLVLGNIERPLPFKNGTMDVVILCEVLEHLIKDAAALHFVRDVLKDDGTLIISTPYYHDEPEYHVRIHNPKTISRLVSACGFHIKYYVERPGILRIPPMFNILHHVLNIMLMKTFGITIYHITLPLIGKFEFFFGKKTVPFRRLSNSFGAYLACFKGDGWNYVASNKENFN